MKRLLLVPLSLVMLAGCGGSPPLVESTSPFVEGAAAAGLHFAQRSGKKEALDIIQTSAGGCGVLDYDGDGDLDLYLVQGQHQPGPGGGNRLFRNRGDGTFEDVTERARVRGRGYGMGCAVGDYDADGRPDLYVCNYGTNELFRNRGDGTFTEVAAQTGTDVRGFSVAAVFADLNGDRRPDLYVARYIDIKPRSALLCHLNGVPTSCGPQSYAAQPGVFLANHGARFADETRKAGLVNSGRGMSVLAGDLTHDGKPDLFVANDTTANAFFVGRGKGRYEDDALMAGVAYGDMGASEANMGVDAGDYDGDGRLDLFVGVMQDRMSLLFRNSGGGLFNLQTRQAGIGEATSGVVTWGCGFLDYDNDGDLDLFQANGHVHSRIQEIESRLTYEQPRQLFENTGAGGFVDRTAAAGPALTVAAAGRGTAFGDLDNDGDVDVLVNNLDGPPMLLWNQAERSGNHWLRVKLVGKRPNTSPEGAVVELMVEGKKRLRHLHTAYSYASANDPRVHFGLGKSARVGPLTVRWPDGTTQQVQVPGVDRELVVRQE